MVVRLVYANYYWIDDSGLIADKSWVVRCLNLVASVNFMFAYMQDRGGWKRSFKIYFWRDLFSAKMRTKKSTTYTPSRDFMHD